MALAPMLPQNFITLRDFVRNDLTQILSSAKPPNYSAAILVCIASEAIGKLLGRKADESVFIRDLLGQYRIPHVIGRSIFNAVRNGLAHFYETKNIVISGEELEVVISWRQYTHLKVYKRDWRNDGINRPGLCLNVHTLCSDLHAFLMTVESRVIQSKKLRRQMEKHANSVTRRERTPAKHEKVWRQFIHNSSET